MKSLCARPGFLAGFWLFWVVGGLIFLLPLDAWLSAGDAAEAKTLPVVETPFTPPQLDELHLPRFFGPPEYKIYENISDMNFQEKATQAYWLDRLLASRSDKFLKDYDGKIEKLEDLQLATLTRIRADLLKCESNISPWARYWHGFEDKFKNPFILLGLIGQFLFTSRFFVQWLASEREKRSVMPVSFWWISVFGSGLELAYGILTKEPVIILGQIGFFTYIRNLYLIFKERRREEEARAAAAAPK